ncbi:tachykinin-4 isoform X3 [Molossus molossus]|uniref:tachykinin-4 isoform X3 n=1 Tax=Molossus molossus TaxID=27622 RepID=UPI0017466C3D|nr:tachykinin-4 isoform X3 [Molossus molossus]
MLLCAILLLLTGLTGLCACTVAGDKKLALGAAEAGPWVTVTLEEGADPSIQLHFQEVKKGKAKQFFGLMGKQVGGHQQGQMVHDLLGKREPSTKGREDEDHGSE